MPGKHPPRPSKIIDALDAKDRLQFSGRVWRTVREGHDVLRGARSGGRWDDGTFDVLYTSLTKEGSIAERLFHLSKGQPVIPSIPKYFAYELEVSLLSVLDLSNLSEIEALGVDVTKFGALSYVERPQEYPSTQQITEIAHFLEFDGVLVPSARSQARNLVIFTERIEPSSLTVIGSPEIANKR